MCDRAHTSTHRLPATVQRLLIRRSHVALLACLALCLPAAALGATKGGSGPVGVGEARAVAQVSLQGSGVALTDLAAEVAGEIRAREAARKERAERERRERFAELPGGVSIETLTAIAECESGGDPTVVSADGSYRGKYQFSFSTWETVGGSGDPAAATEAEQDYRAALLYAQSGSSPWPVCG